MVQAAGRRVLVVDDDQELTELLSVVLEGDGYAVRVAPDGAGALEEVRSGEVDLVLLDVSLADADGRVLLAEIRSVAEIPVIFISGHGGVDDRVLGLRLGADDYLAKPFSPVELVARVESVLRRSRRAGGEHRGRSSDGKGQGAGEPMLSVDERTREVRVDGRQISLTAKEFDLLAFLVRSPRQVFSRTQLLEHVWGSQPGWQDEATVTEHVRRVRRKIERDPQRPRWITTIRGVGYRFEA